MCPNHRPSRFPFHVAGVAMALLLCSLSAQAQMVPRATHVLRQAQSFGQTSGQAWGYTSGVTAVRIGWAGESSSEDNSHTPGLAIRGPSRWPQWEGRVGAVMDRPLDPVRDSYVLTQPAQAGLRMRSMHVLSDYYVGDGFRATLGLVSGESGQAWWSSGERGGGLNLSLQHIDSLGAPVGMGGLRRTTSRWRSCPAATPP